MNDDLGRVGAGGIGENGFEQAQVAPARDFLQRSIAKGGDDGVLGTLDFYLAILIAQAAPFDSNATWLVRWRIAPPALI